jgi:hypothetical protein
MATYEVFMFCDDCGQVHPMSIAFELQDGPVEKASVGDVYKGRELPSQIAQLRDNRIRCPQSGRLVSQKDNNQVFLVPVK